MFLRFYSVKCSGCLLFFAVTAIYYINNTVALQGLAGGQQSLDKTKVGQGLSIDKTREPETSLSLMVHYAPSPNGIHNQYASCMKNPCALQVATVPAAP